MIPTPMCLTVEVVTDGTADAHGNATRVTTSRPWAVHGVAPGAAVEPHLQGRDVSSVALTVYAPAGWSPGEHDAVIVCGERYAVEGRPADWAHGPWANPVAGIVVQLKAVTG